MSPRDPAFEAALTQASDEHALAPWYRDCVRSLLHMPKTQWPRCCGRGCEPCAEQLIAVATRVAELLTPAELSAPAPSREADPTR